MHTVEGWEKEEEERDKEVLEDEVPNQLEGRNVTKEEGGEEPGSKLGTGQWWSWREGMHSQLHGGRWQHLF